MTPGYDALRNGAGIIDLSARGRIRVVGEDRARLLHAMCTNHVNGLADGTGLHAFFLSAQGRILADADILRFPDHLLLDTEPETRISLAEHLDKFIIADDAELQDATDDTFCLGVEGPGARAIVAGAVGPVPDGPFSHVESNGITVASLTATGSAGARIYGPVVRKAELIGMLEAAGAVLVTAADAEIVRIRKFKPRYGSDFNDTTLTGETGLASAMHFQKGCYIGQEIVERVRSRGHVNRTMMGFRLEGHTVPAIGAVLFSGGKDSGEVTSVAEAPDGGIFGLAWVRAPHNKPGLMAGIDGRPAELFAVLDSALSLD